MTWPTAPDMPTRVLSDLVKAIKIEPGTLVVFGDLELDPDPAEDQRRFLALVEAIQRVVGHDQWLALRVNGGTVVGSCTVEEIIAALGHCDGDGS